MYAPFDVETAGPADRIAWALCQILDDDAPMRWTRYRGAVECIARNRDLMADLKALAAHDDLTHECRRWCSGDQGWSKWEPCTERRAWDCAAIDGYEVRRRE